MKHKCWLSWSLHVTLTGAIWGIAGNSLFENSFVTFAQAQTIREDATLGSESSRVNRDAITRPIRGDLIDRGARREANLFHSFEQFDIPEDRGAYFSNPVGVERIFSRVTGSDRSEILGRLGVLGNADLFLINPNGIVFGPNARLDVGGSFTATTANAIQFGDRGSFSASNPELPSELLTINPSAFLFTQAPTGTIESFSRAAAGFDTTGARALGLRVPNGQNLLLLGGDVSLRGRLNTFGGRVELAAIGEPGAVEMDDNGHLSFPDGLTFADVSIRERSRIDVIGRNEGSITIHAANIDVSEISLLQAGIGSGLGVASSQAGDITLQATGIINLDNTVLLNQVQSGATGNSGDINITTERFSATNGGSLRTATAGRGNAGDVNINTRTETSFATGGTSRLRSQASSGVISGAVGNGGNINITTGSLTVENDAEILADTSGRGNAGSVTINASGSVTVDGRFIGSAVNEGAIGNSSGINITARSLFLRNLGELLSYSDGRGNAGDININVLDTVSLSGQRADGSLSSGIFSTIDPGAEGTGGDINITTGVLSITDGATLTASTRGRGNSGDVNIIARDSIILDGGRERQIASSISAAVGDLPIGEDGIAQGEGGDINITTRTLQVSNGASLQTFTAGLGNAGSVTILARDRVSFHGVGRNGSSGILSDVRAGGRGEGGDINITARALSLTNGAQLSTATFESGNAGDVNINTRDTVVLSGVGRNERSSAIFTGVSDGDAAGRGGNINLTTRSLLVTNGAQLIVSTLGQGNAGTVTVNSSDIFLNGTGSNGLSSGIFSSTSRQARGQGGDINVTTNSIRIANGAVVNGQTFGLFRGGDVTINANTVAAIRGGQIITTTAGAGRAGNITLNGADTITLSGVDPTYADRVERFGRGSVTNQGAASGLFANTAANARGQGGTITINTANFTLNNRAEISAQSQGTGRAGNINIRTDELLQSANSNIVTVADQSSGGAIAITASDIRLTGDSDIRTNVDNGRGEGGSITLTADSVIAFDDSDVLAFSQDGQGGNIRLNTPAFFRETYQPVPEGTNPNTLDGNDRVDINASGAIAGIITLPDVTFIQNSLTDLPDAAINPETLVSNSCIARSREQGGSFVITGTGGLPVRPGDAAISDYPTGTVRTVPPAEATENRSWQLGDAIAEPQGVYQLSDGRLVMSRECP